MRNIVLLFAVIFLTGCAISKHVTPVDSNVEISKIYVLENDKVHYQGLVDEIVNQIIDLGFHSESYTGDRPVNAVHYITYTANWTWDIAMYLTYFRATLFEDGRILGKVEYDSRMGGLNLGKFGPARDKIKPLLEELLEKVDRFSG